MPDGCSSSPRCRSARWTDAKRAKLYTTEGEPRTVQWYTQNGFHAVPLKQSDIPTQLKLPTGSINAAPSPPYFALALQFYRDAPYMLDLRVAPLTGATVITDRAWKQISAEDRTKMLEIAAATEKKIQAQAPTLDANAIRDMKDSTKAAKVPFQVITLDAAASAQFRAEADKMTASQRGTLVPADVFDAAVSERAAFRTSEERVRRPPSRRGLARPGRRRSSPRSRRSASCCCRSPRSSSAAAFSTGIPGGAPFTDAPHAHRRHGWRGHRRA